MSARPDPTLLIDPDDGPESTRPVGMHVLGDFWGSRACPGTVAELTSLMAEAATLAGATVLQTMSHVFEPQGLTVVLLLAESHMSLHTWPERDLVAVDIFTCGESMDPQRAIDRLGAALAPTRVVVKTLPRGALPADA